MIKHNSEYVQKIIEKFGHNEVLQLDNMSSRERERYYDHFYKNEYALKPSLWLFRQRERQEYMSYYEISRRLNISVGVVISTEQRALRKIKHFFMQKKMSLGDLL